MKTAAFAAALIGGLLTTSCTKGGGGAKENAVVLIARTGVEADGLKKVAEAFTAKTGVAVDVREEGRSGYEGKVKTTLMGRRPDFDVVFFQSPFVPEFAEAGAIEPLDEYMADDALTDAGEFDFQDFLAVYGYEGKTYALPTDVSTHFLYYRKDLIAEPPQTWDEYRALAAEFTRSKNESSPTLYGAAMSCLSPEELPKIFYSVLWSMGGDLIGPDGRSGLNARETFRAGDYYKSLVKEGLVSREILSWGFPEVKKALQTGEAAMAAPFWNAAYGLILAEEGPYRDKIGAALVPGMRQLDGSLKRAPFQHGWTLVMNSSSKRKSDAWKFIAFATGKEGGRIHALAGGAPARKSILSDAELQTQRPDFALMLESLSMSRAEPPVVFYNQMHETMNAALTSILQDSKTSEDAFREANDALEGLIERSVMK